MRTQGGSAPDPMSIYVKTGMFAAFLASAGLPLYIHLPRFAAGTGISLSTLAAILIGIRMMDFVQDPMLGRLIERAPSHRPLMAGMAVGGIGVGFVWLFTLQPGTPGLVMALVLLFTAYSAATILFYAGGVAQAGPGGHLRLAGWRETGALAGVLLTALAPGLLIALFGERSGYAGFGLLLGAFALGVFLTTRALWTTPVPQAPSFSLKALIRAGGGRLLALAFVNALPVALTSTLFLFFVEDRLQLAYLAGPFLILFFASAGLAAPLWSRAAQSFGARPVLATAMVLAITAFSGAAALAPGAAAGFAAISVGSGIALGADMVILPALFSQLLARSGTAPAAAFGLWSFMAKMALALAAVLALPMLDLAGYSPGAANTPKALAALTFGYAVLPCILKLLAIVMVARLPTESA